MTRLRLLGTAGLAALVLLAEPGALRACAFHTVLPDDSVTERIASGVEVIAARPSARDPFRYGTVALLSGAPSGSAPPDLVDSGTRARLAAHPDDAVLYARAADGSWTRLLLIDESTRPLVDLMVARAKDWTRPAGQADRRDVFAALLAHPDTRLRRLALRELDALPYAVLREGRYPVAEADLLHDISDISEMPYAPIRILLLGLAGSPDMAEAARARVGQLAAGGVDLNLGAWITAAIEAGGPGGVAAVAAAATSRPGGPSAPQLTAIVRAFSVQSAEGDPALRAALDDALRRLVASHREAAPLIAQAFAAAADYSQEALIRDLVAARAFPDRRDLMAAAAYLTRAPAGPLSAARPGMSPATP